MGQDQKLGPSYIRLVMCAHCPFYSPDTSSGRSLHLYLPFSTSKLRSDPPFTLVSYPEPGGPTCIINKMFLGILGDTGSIINSSLWLALQIMFYDFQCPSHVCGYSGGAVPYASGRTTGRWLLGALLGYTISYRIEWFINMCVVMDWGLLRIDRALIPLRASFSPLKISL